jgi:hypothetical protein
MNYEETRSWLDGHLASELKLTRQLDLEAYFAAESRFVMAKIKN